MNTREQEKLGLITELNITILCAYELDGFIKKLEHLETYCQNTERKQIYQTTINPLKETLDYFLNILIGSKNQIGIDLAREH